LKKAIDEQCGQSFETVFQTRLQEADVFYADVIPASLDADAANVMRQALAGMLWSKQLFFMMSTGGSRITASSRAGNNHVPSATAIGRT
jgi:hypothetical protein